MLFLVSLGRIDLSSLLAAFPLLLGPAPFYPIAFEHCIEVSHCINVPLFSGEFSQTYKCQIELEIVITDSIFHIIFTGEFTVKLKEIKVQIPLLPLGEVLAVYSRG